MSLFFGSCNTNHLSFPGKRRVNEIAFHLPALNEEAKTLADNPYILSPDPKTSWSMTLFPNALGGYTAALNGLISACRVSPLHALAAIGSEGSRIHSRCMLLTMHTKPFILHADERGLRRGQRSAVSTLRGPALTAREGNRIALLPAFTSMGSNPPADAPPNDAYCPAHFSDKTASG